jgi:hypothetical protein
VELWVKAADGQLVAVYMNGQLHMHMPVDQRIIAFELFTLLTQMMSRGGGASYGGPISGQVEGDSDFGTAAEPGE